MALKQNKKLLVFPSLSTIAALIVIASFAATFFWWESNREATSGNEVMILNAFFGFAFYFVMYSVIIFFNTALVAAAMKIQDGGEPTVQDGFGIAWSKVDIIVGYALIAATVGIVLRFLEDRLPFVGRIVVSLIGAAWTVATFLVVPVLVSRDIGPLNAVKKSAVMLKKTWGENIIANAGMGLFFGLIYIVLVLLTIFLATAVVPGAIQTVPNSVGSAVMISIIVVPLLMLLLVASIHSALQGIYSAALYRYATAAPGPSDFAPELLNAAFAPKRGKSKS